MPRVAFGDLLVDVDVPASFRCEFSLKGSLLGASDEGGFELSTITAVPKEGSERTSLARDHLTREGLPIRDLRDDLSIQRREPSTTLAAFGNRLLIVTHDPQAATEVERMIGSVALAHDAFGPTAESVQSSLLRESHGLWFRQRRRWLQETFGWRADLPNAASMLDDFWARLVASPPEDVDETNMRISAVAVGLGDLLRPLGFEWCVLCDPWGTNLGTIALRGTANVVVAPDSFVGKRWESSEPRFIEAGVEAIRRSVERCRNEWLPH